MCVQISPGGSLANTLVGVAHLSAASHGRRRLRVSLAGSIGVDPLGQFFSSQMQLAGVTCLKDDAGSGGSHTGTVMVLTTPDAQRSFLSFFTSEALQFPRQLENAIQHADMVVIEGYLWELPGALGFIRKVVDLARTSGAQVVLTAGDPGVVLRHQADILDVLPGVDYMFLNVEEARQLVGEEHCTAAHAAAQIGSMCRTAFVTDGSHGSYVSDMGKVVPVKAHWNPDGPVDTCGAGDAYAAGVLYAVSQGHDMGPAAEFASHVASKVIGRHGAQLSKEDACTLQGLLPEHAVLAHAAPLLPEHKHAVRKHAAPLLPEHTHAVRNHAATLLPEHTHAVRKQTATLLPELMHAPFSSSLCPAGV